MTCSGDNNICPLCGKKIYSVKTFTYFELQDYLLSIRKTFDQIITEICIDPIKRSQAVFYCCMNEKCPRSPVFYTKLLGEFSIISTKRIRPYENLAIGPLAKYRSTGSFGIPVIHMIDKMANPATKHQKLKDLKEA